MYNNKQKKTIDKKALENIDKLTGKRIVHIVYDKNSDKIAEVMRAMISNKDNVKCDLYRDTVYFEQYTISSDNIMIFLGDIKRIKDAKRLAKNARQDKGYGMHYGWVGKEAFIWVEPVSLSKKDKEVFMSEHKKELGILKKKSAALGLGIDVMVLGAFVLIGLGVRKIVQVFLSKKALKHDIFTLAAMKFINNDLEKFIEEARK